jgi:23S rRNA pseudouridine2605 synthase
MPRRSPEPGKRVQLHRALSKLGLGSRAQAWEWIRQGRVRVDNAVITEPLTWIDLNRQKITCDGTETRPAEAITIALYKPRGVVTTRRDERDRRTIYDLLPEDMPWLHPAGRLDADSEGLLILTSDAGLSVRLTDPEHHLPKTYHVTLSGEVSDESIRRLRKGIDLPDGRTRPAQVRVLEKASAETILEFILTEGKNRQIRRMLWKCGHRVRRLLRVAIGNFPLGDLRPGEIRRLTAKEIAMLLSPLPVSSGWHALSGAQRSEGRGRRRR